MSKKDFGEIFVTKTAKKINKDQNAVSDVIEILPEKCSNWVYSDRSEFELGDIQDLAEDIKINGQIQPAIVRKKNNDGYYEIIAGERRWRACSLINRKLQAIVVDHDDVDSFLIQSSENKKEGISTYSKSISYGKILDKKLISQNKLAEKLGMKKSTFSELLSYNFVPKQLWDAVGDMSKVSVSTASYIRKVLNDNPGNLDKLIAISSKIKNGIGKNSIKKLLYDQQDTFSIKDDDGNLLMQFGSKKIVFSSYTLNKASVEDLADILKKHILNIQS